MGGKAEAWKHTSRWLLEIVYACCAFHGKKLMKKRLERIPGGYMRN